MDLPERFWKKVSKDADGCWRWTGATDRGHGIIRMSHPRRIAHAHKVAYSALVGPIPARAHLTWRCETTNCVNPEHLRLMTDTPTCVNGHPRTPENVWTSKQGKRQCRACHREAQAAIIATPRGGEMNRTRMRAWAEAHPDRVAQNNLRGLIRRRKRWEIIKAKVACTQCGESDPACLDFHHRDPAEKQAMLSEVGSDWSRERLERELAKCDVICSNCHRKLHAEERRLVRDSSPAPATG